MDNEEFRTCIAPYASKAFMLWGINFISFAIRLYITSASGRSESLGDFHFVPGNDPNVKVIA